METIKFTTEHAVNFPANWGNGSVMECGIAGEFSASAKRARECPKVQVHLRDGSRAIEATIVGVHESKLYKGRISVAYGDVIEIKPDPGHGKNPVQYIAS